MSVADPDLQIRRGGSGHPHPERRGGTGLQTNFFPPFGPHFARKVRGGGRPPGSATECSGSKKCGSYKS